MENEIRNAFVSFVLLKTGDLPFQVQEQRPETFKLLVAEFVHTAENVLRDWYGCDD